MTVTVYFETERPKYAEMVAKFDNEETYHKCLPILMELCKERNFDFISESLTDEELK